jgi:hypothetical protein
MSRANALILRPKKAERVNVATTNRWSVTSPFLLVEPPWARLLSALPTPRTANVDPPISAGA